MMRFILVLLLAAITSYFAVMVMPWWICMLLSFIIILLLPMKGGKSFLAAALGTAIAYVFMSIQTDMANEHILSSKMAMLFHLPSYVLMIVVTALIGAITSGLGAWMGSALHLLFRKKNIPL
jgi:glycerol uptake facilitator-like aquaporin